MRLIDADRLKADFIGKRYGVQAIEYMIDQQPTVVEAEPIRHGHWIDHTYKYRYPVGRYECSMCGAAHDMEWDYCPTCGTHMDGGDT